MLRNNRPYTNENGWEDGGLLTDHNQETQDKVLHWIEEKIQPCKSPLKGHSSYGLKHYLERDLGIYLTNNEFKDAMWLSGYYPVNVNALNWIYCISRKSKVFQRA